VREGGRVIITLHGEPAVELRPIASAAPRLADRLDALSERGIVVRRAPGAKALPPIAKRRGALNRFLAERE
jgi:antitoxin (DNA-binding transcriptional repressor) of toxin-antitoxin stability system